MKIFEKSSLTLMNKIITYFVGYMILVMFVFSLLVYIVDYTSMKEINKSYSLDMVHQEGRMVENWLDDTVQKLNDYSAIISASHDDLFTSMDGLITLQQENNDLFRHLYLVKPSGQYLDTFGQEANMVDDQVAKVLSGEIDYMLTEPAIHPVLSEGLFNIIVPVKSGDNIVGALGASVTLDQLRERLESFQVAGAGFGWLLNADLTVIASPNEDQMLKMSLYSNEALSKESKGIISSDELGYSGLSDLTKNIIDKSEATGKYTDPNGYSRTVSIVPVSDKSHWYVAFTTFDDKVPTTSSALLLYMAIGVAFIVLTTIFATYWLANEITKPINQLIHVVNLFISGNKGVRAKVDSNDEFGSLGKAFNGMADTIIEHTDNVEELIQERTHMLADLNYQIVVRNKELNTMNVELENTNSKLHSLATTDMLTGLYNRHELVRSLQGFMDDVIKGDEAGFSVLFVDLDNFKYYNDTFSHEIGDFLLIEVSKILKANVRDNDVVARYGGDEFVVLLKHGDFEASKMISERIHAKLLEKKGFRKEIERKIGSEIKLLGKNMLSCSIGIVNYNRNVKAANVEELLALADDTMYKAKKQGKSRIVVN